MLWNGCTLVPVITCIIAVVPSPASLFYLHLEYNNPKKKKKHSAGLVTEKPKSADVLCPENSRMVENCYKALTPETPSLNVK